MELQSCRLIEAVLMNQATIPSLSHLAHTMWLFFNGLTFNIRVLTRHIGTFFEFVLHGLEQGFPKNGAVHHVREVGRGGNKANSGRHKNVTG